MKRTQLNVSIDPKLLEKIKESARISGKSLVGFVSDCFVNQIENLPVESIDSRFQTIVQRLEFCHLYTSPSPRDRTRSRMPSSA